MGLLYLYLLQLLKWKNQYTTSNDNDKTHSLKNICMHLYALCWYYCYIKQVYSNSARIVEHVNFRNICLFLVVWVCNVLRYMDMGCYATSVRKHASAHSSFVNDRRLRDSLEYWRSGRALMLLTALSLRTAVLQKDVIKRLYRLHREE
jgi:hypothetical protein